MTSSVLLQFNNVATLRANSVSAPGALAVLSGYSTSGDPGQGLVWLNTADTTSSDNGGTIFVDVATPPNRWYRETGPYVRPEYFGAVGNGTTDDSSAFTRMMSALGLAGGLVVLSPTGKYYLSTGVTVPTNVTVEGSHAVPEMQQNNFNFTQIGSTLIIASSASITLSTGSAIKGAFIYRYGLIVETTYATIVAALAMFSGTAIQMSGGGCSVIGCGIMGFALAINTTSPVSGVTSRPVIERVRIDCLSGISVQHVGDLGYIHDVHCWPFYTQAINSGPTASNRAAFQRSGAAFSFSGAPGAGADGMKCHDLFEYGYATGYLINDSNVLRFYDCGVDGPDFLPNTAVGWQITGTGTGGTASDIIIIGSATSSCQTSFLINAPVTTGSEQTLTMIGCSSESTNTNNHVLIEQGNVRIHNCYFKYGSAAASTVGVNITSTNSVVFLRDSSFESVTTPIQIVSSAAGTFDWGGNSYFNCPNQASLPWTPVLEFGGSSTGITYGPSAASYTIYNGVATVSVALNLTSKGTASGNAALVGLPFTINSAAGGGSPFIMGGMTSLSGPVIAALYLGSSSVTLYESNSGGIVHITDANFTNGSALSFVIEASV